MQVEVDGMNLAVSGLPPVRSTPIAKQHIQIASNDLDNPCSLFAGILARRQIQFNWFATRAAEYAV